MKELAPLVAFRADEALDVYALVGGGLIEVGFDASSLPRPLGDVFGTSEPIGALEAACRRALVGDALGLQIRWRGKAFDVRLRPSSSPSGVEGVLTAVIERRMVDAGMSSLMNNIAGMAYRCRNDTAWTMEVVSDGCLAVTGYTVEQLRDNAEVAFGDLVHPEDAPPLWEKCQANLDAGRFCSNRYRIRTAAGEWRWVWDQAQGVYGDKGELQFIEGLVTDITEQKLAEERQERSQEQLELAVEGADLALWDFDERTDRLSTFRAGALGLPSMGQELALEEFLASVVHPSDQGTLRSAMERLTQDRDGTLSVEVRMGSEDGWHWIGVRGRSLKRDGSRRLAGTFQNRTEVREAETARHRLREQLFQSQKMESVGQLAGGIAHDFNNLLLVIGGNVRLARQSNGLTSQALEDLEQAGAAVERAADLTRALLAFGRKGTLELDRVQVNDVVDGTVAMIRRLIPANIALDIIPGSGLSAVEADATQLQQVLTNLCLNARDAMPRGGRITVETEAVLINGEYRRAHPWAEPGRYILVTVSDTGHGIPAEHLDRVFEPFFTTKEVGEGTGLGLSVVYGIVKQHRGMVHVYSEVGIGTSFKVYLPASERSAAEVGPKLQPEVPKGKERVLVVEDAPEVLTLVARVLSDAGYEVLRASDGLAGLEVARQESGRLDLVILDAVMPGLSGPELMTILSREQPDLKVLLTTGYSASALPQGLIGGKQVVLHKPYDPDALLRQIRAVLDE